MARGAPFTDVERQAVIAAYRAGQSIGRIAAQLCRSTFGVRNVLIKAGVSMRPRHRPTRDPAPFVAAYDAGESLNDIARRVGMSPSAVRYYLVRAGVARRPAGWPKDAWQRKAAV